MTGLDLRILVPGSKEEMEAKINAIMNLRIGDIVSIGKDIIGHANLAKEKTKIDALTDKFADWINEQNVPLGNGVLFLTDAIVQQLFHIIKIEVKGQKIVLPGTEFQQ